MKALALLALAGSAIASAVPPSRSTQIEACKVNYTPTAPCAQVSQHMHHDANKEPNRMIPAELAWDCINSVPFNATSGKHLLHAIRPYVQWQSTIVALKTLPMSIQPRSSLQQISLVA